MQSNSDMIWPISYCSFWSPSSGLHDHHHHRHDTMISIIGSSCGCLHQLLLLWLLLPLRDKVKQLQGVCISYNKTPCNYFTLLLTVSYSSRSNSWRDNFMKTRWWRSWCHAGDDDDHGAPKMKIKRSKMILAISCHYLIACDVYHVLHLICLERR